MTENTKPLGSVRIGNVEATIWPSKTEGAPPSVTFQRHYRDKDGNWQHTGSFNIDDVPVVEKVAAKALDKALELQKGAFAARYAA